jgi:hypothetical protein
MMWINVVSRMDLLADVVVYMYRRLAEVVAYWLHSRTTKRRSCQPSVLAWCVDSSIGILLEASEFIPTTPYRHTILTA